MPVDVSDLLAAPSVQIPLFELHFLNVTFLRGSCFRLTLLSTLPAVIRLPVEVGLVTSCFRRP